jgi:hypothetical protein
VRLKSLTAKPRIVASMRFMPTQDMLAPPLRPQPRRHRVRCCAGASSCCQYAVAPRDARELWVRAR